MSRIVLVILIYHRHKPVDLINKILLNFLPTVNTGNMLKK
jgi:hypothetical protein